MPLKKKLWILLPISSHKSLAYGMKSDYQHKNTALFVIKQIKQNLFC
jgi:hypothetical protein